MKSRNHSARKRCDPGMLERETRFELATSAWEGEERVRVQHQVLDDVADLPLVDVERAQIRRDGELATHAGAAQDEARRIPQHVRDAGGLSHR